MNLPEHTPGPSPVRRPWLGCSLVVVGFLVLLAVLILIGPLGFIMRIHLEQRKCEALNEGEYARHRMEYEAIIRAIQSMPNAVGPSTPFRINPDKNPASLRPIATFDRGTWENVVEAQKRPDGRLTVRICTYNLGHAGVYGLYYSSGPPPSGEVENSFGIDGHIAPVAPNWWRISDYSQ